jgi:1-acyl-sn-glycerol-3-phosphate acyltransferase
VVSTVPPRPKTVGARVARLGLRIMRWEFAPSDFPPPRAVILAVPHSTNLDGLLLVLLTRSIGMPGNWMVKDLWVRPPIGWLTRRLGAVGVRRSMANGMVGQMSGRFATNDEFLLLVPPEGTRSRVDYWKSGFYRIALEADVPVVPSYLDYRNRRAGFLPAIALTGEPDVDMDAIRSVYPEAKEMARHPARIGPIQLRDESTPSV